MDRSTMLRVARNAGLILAATYIVISFILLDWAPLLASARVRAFWAYMLFASIFVGWLIDTAQAARRAKTAGIPVREG